MSFFQAIDYENQHLDRLIYSYFPHSLKRRVLIALLDPLIQSEHSIDSLVSHLYKIYHNRFDTNEKVIVDLSFNRPPSASSTVYYAKILKVFPPKPVRDLGKSNYHDLIHLQTMERFKVDLRQALEWDDSKSYLYTIQLIDDHRSRENGEDDQEDHFEASYMEVEPRKLSRHPNTFSKSLLKKFIQSLLLPYSANRHSSPKWRVAAHVLAHYRIVDPHNNSHLPVSPSHDPSIHPQKRVKKNQHASTLKPEPTVLPAKKKQHHLKNHVHPFLPPEIQSYPHLIEAKTVDKGLKRKKKKKKRSDLLEPIIISANPKEIYPSVQYPLPVKELASLKPVEVLPAITPPIKEAKKYIKYPILLIALTTVEDLELDPLTIIDGRHLRKIGPMSPTSLLPLKPKVSQNAGKKMGRALRIWSFFNIFKFNENGLGLRFDEFECKLDQIIGRLIRALLEESHLRYPNTRHGKGRNFSSMSILPYFSNWPHQETEVMTIEEREYWVRKGIRIINLWKKKADAIAANAGGGLGANREYT
ncbi:expressed protein [Phakopsora pachyrhizi]|uniref:Expressed protein n=1 Tax=Phakopsora pachyrhizi TaxID=170000 RepID=A0AAV0AKH8_PHAPC|nr:expressed protein [Phakopsora pachyrhizi]